MNYDVTAEYVAIIFATILYFYSREPNMVPTLQNRLFRLYLALVLAYSANVVFLRYSGDHLSAYPLWALHLTNVLQLLMSTALPVVGAYYLLAVASADELKLRSTFRWASLPFVAFAIAVLATPFTGLIYTISPVTGFTEGPAFFLSYTVGALYLFWVVGLLLVRRKRLDPRLRRVVVVIPVLGLFLVLVMITLPRTLMTGMTATALALIIYFYLQNKGNVIDELTGLQNRKAFAQVAGLHLRRQSPVEVVLVSLNDFRLVNDKFGIAAGDALLRAFSAYLSSRVGVRSVYRYAGDEFALMLEGDGGRGEQIARTIADRLSRVWEFDQLSYRLDAGIAVVSCPQQAGTLEECIDLLEECTTLAKRGRVSTVVVASPDAIARSKRHHQIAGVLREAIQQGRLDVHYQPIFSVAARRFTSAEALVRLNDPALGSISPGEFIPIAEATGLIGQLGYIVLDRACGYIRECAAEGLSLSVSVNFSAQQFYHQGMVETVMAIIRDNGIDPSRIRIEITESVFADDVDNVAGIMHALREQGIEFHLDDFGTGYSNLSNVVELPFSTVKIDRSLLYNAVRSDKSLAMLRGLVRTLTDTSMTVVVEGVEDEVQRDLAIEIGANHLQGFLLARPMPAAQALELLQVEPAQA